MGYHKYKINKGTLGLPSKIREEYEEFVDAVQQENHIMAIIELSDMLGAMEAYIKRYKMNLDDLIIMKNATKSAFEDGSRKSNDEIKWKCRRCNTIVDMKKFKCKCKTSPSPWE
jgi:hypothetical protein